MTPDFLSTLNIVLTVCLVIGGFFAVRKGFSKENAAIQEQTINALKARIEALESQAETDAKELKRLRQVLNTVRYALKRKTGMIIEIDGDFVTLIDNGKSESTPLQDDSSKIRPIKPPKPSKNDDDVV